MRPIDADAKVKHFRKLSDEYSERERNECDIRNKAYYRGRALAFSIAADLIDISPTLDVQSVVHGKWVSHNPKNPSKIFHCGNCLGLVEMPHYTYDCYYKYCPNCGAKMDKEKSNEKTDT